MKIRGHNVSLNEKKEIMLKDVKIAEEKFKFEWQQTVPHKFKNDKERAGNVHRLFMHMFCVKMIRVCQNLNFISLR